MTRRPRSPRVLERTAHNIAMTLGLLRQAEQDAKIALSYLNTAKRFLEMVRQLDGRGQR